MQRGYLREKEQVCEVDTGLIVYIMKERRINLVRTIENARLLYYKDWSVNAVEECF
jgi:hypothetical protein